MTDLIDILKANESMNRAATASSRPDALRNAILNKNSKPTTMNQDEVSIDITPTVTPLNGVFPTGTPMTSPAIEHTETSSPMTSIAAPGKQMADSDRTLSTLTQAATAEDDASINTFEKRSDASTHQHDDGFVMEHYRDSHQLIAFGDRFDMQQELTKYMNETIILRRELQRQKEEKVTATEIFSQTIAKYECDISNLQKSMHALIRCNSNDKRKKSQQDLPQKRHQFEKQDDKKSANGEGIMAHEMTTTVKDPSVMTLLQLSPILVGSETSQKEFLHSPSPRMESTWLSSCASIDCGRYDDLHPKKNKVKNAGAIFLKSLMGKKVLTLINEEDPALRNRELIANWTVILKDWKRYYLSKNLTKLAYKGIPCSLRAEVWRAAIGNQLSINRSLYEKLLQSLCALREYLRRTSKRYQRRMEDALGFVINDELSNELSRASHAVDHMKKQISLSTKNNEDNKRVDIEIPIHHKSYAELKCAPHSKSKDSSPDQQKQHECDLCRQIWPVSLISAFETLSADLHRTFPRLGVITPLNHLEKEPDQSLHTRKKLSCDSFKNLDFLSAATAEEPSQICQLLSPTSHGKEQQQDRRSEISIDPALSQQRHHQHEKEALKKEREIETTKEFAAQGHLRKDVNLPCGGINIRRVQQLYSRLRLLLEVFALFRPDYAYVQGMGFLAAVILLHVENNFEAFVMFANLMARQCFLAFYTFDFSLLNIYIKTFDFLLRDKMPNMTAALKEAQIPSSQFLVDWMYTLFTRCLPFDIVCRIWDIFLISGDAVLFQVSLAMFRCFLSIDRHDENQNFNDRLSVFLSSSSTTHFAKIDANKFLEFVQSFHVSNETLIKIMRNCKNSTLPKNDFIDSLNNFFAVSGTSLVRVFSQLKPDGSYSENESSRAESNNQQTSLRSSAAHSFTLKKEQQSGDDTIFEVAAAASSSSPTPSRASSRVTEKVTTYLTAGDRRNPPKKWNPLEEEAELDLHRDPAQGVGLLSYQQSINKESNLGDDDPFFEDASVGLFPRYLQQQPDHSDLTSCHEEIVEDCAARQKFYDPSLAPPQSRSKKTSEMMKIDDTTTTTTAASLHLSAKSARRKVIKIFHTVSSKF